jgi:hypothetical protein
VSGNQRWGYPETDLSGAEVVFGNQGFGDDRTENSLVVQKAVLTNGATRWYIDDGQLVFQQYEGGNKVWKNLFKIALSSVLMGAAFAGAVSCEVQETNGGADPSTWTQKTVGSDNRNGVGYGGGQFVAVGNAGAIAVSADGATWTQKTVGSNAWRGVGYGGGQFVAVGNAATMAVSADGETWTQKTVGSGIWRGVGYGGDKFVAVGNVGRTAVSGDGVNWTQKTVGSNGWLGVAYGGGQFVAVGDGGAIAVSADGENWTQKTVGSGYWNGVAYGVGQFVAVSNGGGMAYSGEGAAPVAARQAPVGLSVTDCVRFAFRNSTLVVLDGTPGIAGVVRDAAGRYTVNFVAARPGRRGLCQALAGANGAMFVGGVYDVTAASAKISIYDNNSDAFIDTSYYAEALFFG